MFDGWSQEEKERHITSIFLKLYDEELIRIFPSDNTIHLLSKSRKLDRYVFKWIQSVYGSGAWASNLCDFDSFPIKNKKLYDSIEEDMERMVEKMLGLKEAE